MTSVSICIATYKRPEGLTNLLQGINNLEFHHVEPPSIEIIVIDNDISGSAQETCAKFKDILRWPLVYDIEPQKGVSHARNRSVAHASDNSNFIVFIDDDEVPATSWLDELLSTQKRYGSDVVGGPVYPIFENDSVPYWIKAGGFFEPHQHETGQEVNAAYTGNVLVDANLLRQLDYVFDPRLALKGSEDTHLFMRLRKMGARIVWTRSAVAWETVPASRTTLYWILKRNFWGWSSYSLFEKELFPSLKVRSIRFLKGLALLVAGSLSSIPHLFLGRHRFYQSLIMMFRGAGTLAGLMNIQGNW